MAVGKTPGAVDAHQRPEARPLVFLEEEGEVGGDPAAARLQAAVAFLDLLKVGGPRGGDVAHDRVDDAPVRGVVRLERQDVIPLSLHNRLYGGDLRVERVGRDDASPEVEAPQELGDVGDLVALRLDGQLADGESRPRRPRIQDVNGLPPLRAPAERLPVHRDRFRGARPLTQPLGHLLQQLRHRLRFQRLEQTVEGVRARRRRHPDMLPEPHLVLLGETLHLLKRVSVGKISTDRDCQEHLDAVHLPTPVPRILRLRQNRQTPPSIN